MRDWIGENIHAEKILAKPLHHWDDYETIDGIYSRSRLVEKDSVCFQEILLESVGSSSDLYQKGSHQGSIARWNSCLFSFPLS